VKIGGKKTQAAKFAKGHEFLLRVASRPSWLKKAEAADHADRKKPSVKIRGKNFFHENPWQTRTDLSVAFCFSYGIVWPED